MCRTRTVLPNGGGDLPRLAWASRERLLLRGYDTRSGEKIDTHGEEITTGNRSPETLAQVGAGRRRIDRSGIRSDNRFLRRERRFVPEASFLGGGGNDHFHRIEHHFLVAQFW